MTTAWAGKSPTVVTTRLCPRAGRTSVTSTPVRITPPRVLDVARELERDTFEVDDPRIGGVQALEAAHVGLDLGEPRPVDLPQPGDTVLAAAPVQLLETRNLALRRRDDELAAALIRDLLAIAVLVEQLVPLDAQTRLERSRRVVDPRVDDAAVVSRLMARKLVLLLQQRQPDSGVTCDQLASDRETEDASADDDDVLGPAGSKASTGPTRTWSTSRPERSLRSQELGFRTTEGESLGCRSTYSSPVEPATSVPCWSRSCCAAAIVFGSWTPWCTALFPLF